MNPPEIQTLPSALVAPNGAIIFQGGMLTQALVLTRSAIDRFLTAPTEAEPLVIPSFASAGLACYTATGDVESIEIIRDDDDHFSLAIKLRHGDHVVYFSRDADAEGPVALAARGITVVITPRSIATVHKLPRPALSVVACLPQSQECDLSNIYATRTTLLRHALAEALARSNRNLHYEN